jgi:hypothetical protein
MIIKIIIIIAALGIFFFVINGHQTQQAKAWKKVIICFLVAAMIFSAIYPEITNQIANIVGIGRGPDLVLYVLSLAFIGYVINSYTRQQRAKDITYRLARRVALLDANGRYGIKK